MTRNLLVASLCVAALAGCSRTVIREQVVEKEPVVNPPTVTRETIVERPTVTRETIVATTPAACSLAGTAYAHGTLSCQAGYEYRCRNGVWERIPGNVC